MSVAPDESRRARRFVGSEFVAGIRAPGQAKTPALVLKSCWIARPKKRGAVAPLVGVGLSIATSHLQGLALSDRSIHLQTQIARSNLKIDYAHRNTLLA